MQPYGPYVRGIQKDSQAKEQFADLYTTSVGTQEKTITVTPVPIAEQSPVESILGHIQSLPASSIVPSQSNLDSISGAGESATVALTQAYTPNREVLAPHQAPRTKPSVRASLPTELGTGAEDILRSSVDLPSVREHVRTEEPGESEDFKNPYAATYHVV